MPLHAISFLFGTASSAASIERQARGKDYVKEYSAVAAISTTQTRDNTIGFGAFKPFIILHLLELLERRQLDQWKGKPSFSIEGKQLFCSWTAMC